MPKVKLTEAAVQRFKAEPGERVNYFDATLPGFALRVSGKTDRNPSGSKHWILFYRHGGKQKMLTFGGYPGLGLAEARKRAGEASDLLEAGEDPGLAKKAAEQKARDQLRDTVEAAVKEFLAYLEGKERAPRYIAETRRLFTLHVIPVWKCRPIGSIARREAVELLKGVAAGGKTPKRRDGDKRTGARGGKVAANRVKSALSALFNWAIREELIDASPITHIEKPSAERKKTRVLTDRELQLVWRASAALPYPKGPYFRFILATAQRREETGTMRWTDIHEADDLWMIPPEANKPDRTHAVPLSRLARHVIEQCPRSGKHVFTSRRMRGAKPDEPDADAPMSGYSAAKAELDEIAAALAKQAGEAPPDPWTIHDLRRTAATVMGKLGVSRFIQKRVLNHADNDVTGIYDRYEYLPEKRHALELWGSYLEQLIASAPNNVVDLIAERASVRKPRPPSRTRRQVA